MKDGEIIVGLLWLLAICGVHSMTTAATHGLYIEFPNDVPSFTIKPTPTSDMYLSFTFTSISELRADGSTVVSYGLPSQFVILRDDNLLNNTLLQTLHFEAHFPNKAFVSVEFLIASTNSTVKEEIYLQGTTYTIKDYYPLLLFNLQMKNWTFADPSSQMQTVSSVTVNAGALSVGYKETDTAYLVSVPFFGSKRLASSLPKVGMKDGKKMNIQTQFTITSLSTPIGAVVYNSFSAFNQSVSYNARMQVVIDDNSVNYVSIIITVSVVLILIVLIVALGCFMCRQHKKAQEIKTIDDQGEKKTKVSPNSTYNTVNASKVSISSVLSMKV
eukprot:TRINITY_DN20420_c0_g2_i1.p1 TRINITY_DN20420_c0_g2~~TRINITY_DN20420_c0_g2_i1.p1  ORF type:complete len:329 (+),score=37.66 TRINITY_DN20420_c0_g2_i1:17-1003(+)